MINDNLTLLTAIVKQSKEDFLIKEIKTFAFENQISRKSLILILEIICKNNDIVNPKKEVVIEYIDALEGNINVSCFEKLYKDPSDINELVDFVKCKGYEKMDYYVEEWRDLLI